MLDSNINYSSLKVHLAAIVAYAREDSCKSFFKAPVIKSVLERSKRIAPPRKAPAPMWSLSTVLTQLMTGPFEPMHKAELKYITIKTPFLIAKTSLRRVSELPALT